VSENLSEAKLKVTDPEDFTKDAQLYRRNVLLSSTVGFMIYQSVQMEPSLLGIKISPIMMWTCLIVAHIYQFLMWRLTSPVEMDSEKKLFNYNGLYKQAFLGGIEKFPSKTKAQIFMLRALPIWAFIFGLCCMLAGLVEAI